MHIKQARAINLFWAPGEAVEHRRIIDEYRNYNPLRAIAGIAHASRNLPTRDK